MTTRSAKLIAVLFVIAAAAAIGVLLMAHSGMGTESVLRTNDTKPNVPSTENGGYSVTMSPVGTVRFERPPERIVTQDANYNDMLVAVSRDDKLITTGYQQLLRRLLPAVDGSQDRHRFTEAHLLECRVGRHVRQRAAL